MHQVSDTELDAIVSGGNSIHMTFFGLCGGVVVTCVVVLTTVTMTDPVTHAGYVAALIVCGVLGLFFGIRGVSDYRTNKRKLKEIKSGDEPHLRMR